MNFTDQNSTLKGGYVPHASAPTVTVPNVGNGFSIAAIVLGILAVFVLPIVLGPIGLGLAAKAKSRGESNAQVAMKVAGIGMAVGFVLGAIAYSALAANSA